MKDLRSIQNIYKAITDELKSAVTYNAYFVSQHLMAKHDLIDIFGQSDDISSSAPFDIYLGRLKKALGDDYDEHFLKEIYKNAFCESRRSSFSVHIQYQRQLGKNASSELIDIYIDTNMIVEKLANKFQFNHSIMLIENTPGIYEPYRSPVLFKTFYGDPLHFIKDIQPGFSHLNLSENRLIQRRMDSNFLLKIGARLSACASIIAISIAILAISSFITLQPVYIAALIASAGILAYSSYCFFDRSQPPQQNSVRQNLVNLPKPAVIDIQQAFYEHFGSNKVEELSDTQHPSLL
ncbi:MAG: hypothetical protein CK423_09510 [Legionella sp.]|nr:MAG: hypothetical protein CK423_09510 [Legionella sp.]